MSNLFSLADATGHYCARLVEAAPIKIAIALLVSWAGWLSTPGITQAAIWLLIADWVTGLIKSGLQHQINSDSGVRGAIKSLIYLSLLAVAGVIASTGGSAAAVGEWIGVAIVLTEAVSNLENLDAIACFFGVEVPVLKRALAVLRMKAALEMEKEA